MKIKICGACGVAFENPIDLSYGGWFDTKNVERISGPIWDIYLCSNCFYDIFHAAIKENKTAYDVYKNRTKENDEQYHKRMKKMEYT